MTKDFPCFYAFLSVYYNPVSSDIAHTYRAPTHTHTPHTHSNVTH